MKRSARTRADVQAQVAWSAYNYYGDRTTRKFPYDGLNKEPGA
jgi:hypothetical protein